MSLYFTEIYHFICVFLILVYFSPTNFAENLKVSLSRIRILLNLKEILVNAWTLQNCGDLFAYGLQKELCALEYRNVKKKIKILFCHFSFM